MLTRQPMYVQTLTLRRVSRGKAISTITYSECVSVALIIQHAMRMRHIICRLWPVCLCYIFPHYLTNGTTIGEKNLLNIKSAFLFSL